MTTKDVFKPFKALSSSVDPREHRRCGRQNGLVCLTSVLNDDGIAACGSLGLFMIGNMLGSF